MNNEELKKRSLQYLYDLRYALDLRYSYQKDLMKKCNCETKKDLKKMVDEVIKEKEQKRSY